MCGICGIIDYKKGDSALSLKFPHKGHLVLVDVRKGKGIHGTLLGVEADRYALHCADIVHGALLLKIGQPYGPAVAVEFHGGYRCGYLLNESQVTFQIFFICAVNEVLQGRAP